MEGAVNIVLPTMINVSVHLGAQETDRDILLGDSDFFLERGNRSSYESFTRFQLIGGLFRETWKIAAGDDVSEKLLAL